MWFHNATWTADPIGGIRTMLDNEMLESAGPTTFEARSVLRLVGEEPGTVQNGSPGGPVLHEYLVNPSLVGAEPAAAETGSQNGPTAYEYLVDAMTFAPVRVPAAPQTFKQL